MHMNERIRSWMIRKDKDDNGMVARLSVLSLLKNLKTEQSQVLSMLIYDFQQFILGITYIQHFSIPQFRTLAARVYDYIRTYMSGPKLRHDEVPLIRVLEDFSTFWDKTDNLYEDELELCREVIRALLYQMENNTLDAGKSAGRMLPLEYKVFVQDELDIGFCPQTVHGHIDLDDFENELKRLVEDKNSRL